VNLNGYITILDPAAPEKPKKVIYGHNKAPTALAFDSDDNRLLTGDSEAQLIRWDVATADNLLMGGKGHTNQITRIRVQGSKIVTAAKDDTIRFSDKSTMQWGASVSLEGAPLDLAVGTKDQSLVIAVTSNAIVVLKDGKLAQTVATGYEATSVALNYDNTKVAVGDSKGAVRVYNISGTSLSESSKFEGLTMAVTTAAFSHDGKWFAAADANRSILVWDAKAGGAAKLDSLKYHSSKPVSLVWAADSKHFITAGLDGSIFVWDVEKPDQRIHIKDAHKGGISEAVWVNPTTVASVGVDACLKTWSIKFH